MCMERCLLGAAVCFVCRGLKLALFFFFFFFSLWPVCTVRHYLPFGVVQGRPVRGAGRGVYSPEFIVAPLEAHATHQNSFLLHVQLEFRYQGDM